MRGRAPSRPVPEPEEPPYDVLPSAARWEPLGAELRVAVSAGIWRADGRIVKLLRPDREGHPLWPSSLDPDDPMWWRREADFYEAKLPLRGLSAPAAEVVERADGSVALVLEELHDSAAEWPLERYQLAARDLGLLQASSAGLARARWLSRGWLHAYVERRHRDFAGPPAAPFVAGAIRVWRERGRFLDVLDRLPRVLCHLDLYPANLFDRDGRTIAIDWAFVGLGALGEDAGNLVVDSLLDGFVPAARADELAERVESGYLAGLRAGGCKPEEPLVRLGMRAATAVKYCWVAPRLATGPWASADERQVHDVLRLLAEWADEARRLVDELPLRAARR